MFRRLTILAFVLPLGFAGLPAVLGQQNDLAAQLRKLDATVFTAADAKERKLGTMAERDIRVRIHEAHQRVGERFDTSIESKDDWQRFSAPRIQALRESLGPLPALGGDLNVKVGRTYKGQGYIREDIVFESRPGLLVTANLYAPAQPAEKMPGILIVHGFHQPKSQAELQDMGVNWAKLGCLVLVPDVLGHGERRQHPFVDVKTYSGKSTPTRQDYYGRANTGLQLALAGDSLMGWMAFDTMRGVDLLLSRPGIDGEKIVVLGAVAGGGDIAAVAGALDQRIGTVVAYNFGGPEPETVHPLPAKDAELVFPYATGGHWDDTRRLRNSARDGFLPWVVLGAIAPRRLIYAHEFSWDKAHDPVYPRLEKVATYLRSNDKVGFMAGGGTLYGKPEGSGCANIGAFHRQYLYPTLKRWEIPVPAKEVQDRKPDKDFLCLTPEILKASKSQPVYQLAAEIGRARLQAAQQQLGAKKPAEAWDLLRHSWGKLLGDVEPQGKAKVVATQTQKLGAIAVERLALEVEPGIVVPCILLLPARTSDQRVPVVVAFAQHGKQEFLKQRADGIAELLQAGNAVCLADVRGTGETRADGDLRGPPAGTYKGVQATSNGTLLANEDLMLGRTLLGDRLRDLRSVLHYLKTRPEIDGSRLALWGDSFAPVNSPTQRVDVPWDAAKLPAQSEPLGGLLALFAALWEDDVRAVAVNGCLASFASLLDGPFCHVPHDALVPGALTAGDLGDLAAALAPRPLRLDNAVDGVNRRASPEALGKAFEAARASYGAAKADDKLMIDGKDKLTVWLVAQLKK